MAKQVKTNSDIKWDKLEELASDLPLFSDKDYEQKVSSIPSGSIALDMAIGVGGYPRGAIIDVFGAECISSDTIIRYNIVSRNGRKQNNKGGTIEDLYYRFNRLDRPGRGKYQRPQTIRCCFTVPSINSAGCVFQNPVLNVIKSGMKKVFEITTSDGNKIKATPEHKFYIGDGKYKRLDELSIGDMVYVHNNTRNKGIEFVKHSKEVYVKTHPAWRSRMINGYKYHRARVSVAMVEAIMNNKPYKEFVDMLNYGKYDKKSIRTVPSNCHVHHIDHNDRNDSLSNLIVMTGSEHNRLHALYHHNKLRFIAVPMRIINIVSSGQCMTYDITCPYPNNNFVANKFIVHNSGGKSLLSIMAIAQVQKQNGTAVVWDAERSYSKNLTWMRVNGVDTSKVKFLRLRPTQGCEIGFDAIEKICKAQAADLIVIDSVPSLIPQSALEREMTDNDIVANRASIITRACGRLVGILDDNKTVLMFINQLRANIGAANMYAPKTKETTQYALKHFASLRLSVSKISKSEIVNGLPYSHRVRVVAVKNKVAPPYRTAEFSIIYLSGVDTAGEIADILIGSGEAEKAGAWIKYEGEKYNGRDAFVDALRKKEVFDKALKHAMSLADKVNIFGVQDASESTIKDEVALLESMPAAE